MPSSGITVTNTFANQTGPIPLSQLDTNFTQDANQLNSLGTYANYFVDSSGAPNTITVTVPAPLIFSYVAGMPLQVKLANTNTATAVNINVNALGNVLVLNNDGSAPAVGSLIAGMILNLQHDGTRFRLTSQVGSSFITTGLFGDGTAGAPSISFISDTDTGMYHIGSNTIGFSGGSISSFQIAGGVGSYSLDGSVGSPSISFISDTDTGMYRIGANQVGFAANGSAAFEYGTFGIQIDQGVLKTNDGTAGAPGLSFSNDTDTGIYRITVNTVGFSAGGALTFQYDTLGIYNILGTSANPAYTFSLDADTGMYRVGANILGFSCAGAQMLRLDAATAAVSALAFQLPDGTAGSPVFTFSADTDTGIYRAGANDIRIVAGGAVAFTANATQSIANNPFYNSNQGSAGTPVFSWTGDTNTGIYQAGLDTINFATGGVNRMQIGAAGNISIDPPTGAAVALDITGNSGALAVQINASGGNAGLTINSGNASYGLNLNNSAYGAGNAAIRVVGSATTGATTATFSATNKPGAGTTVATWLPINLDGTVRYIPCWA